MVVDRPSYDREGPDRRASWSAENVADGVPAPGGRFAPGDRPGGGLQRQKDMSGLGSTGAAIVPVPRGPARPTAAGGRWRWAAGDHVRTMGDADDDVSGIAKQVGTAKRYGLGWLVISDQGGVLRQADGGHQSWTDLRQARSQNPDLLVLQGLEWNAPDGGHATVLVTPGHTELAVLREFELLFSATAARSGSPGSEATAVNAVRWLRAQMNARWIDMSLVLLNHPGSHAQLRRLRHLDPGLVIGIQGAPGHPVEGIRTHQGGEGHEQAGSVDAPDTPGGHKYPLEPYGTRGGFSWMIATVGGVWDAMLAEGLPSWITAIREPPAAHYEASRAAGPPPATIAPGRYRRTHLGLHSFDYVSVLDAMRSGRTWIDHGQLVDSLDVTFGGSGSQHRGTLGESVSVRRGDAVELVVRIRLASVPNHAGDLPLLRRVDLIAGPVTGASSDQHEAAPDTRVVRSFEITRRVGTVELRHQFRDVDAPFYLRLRGTDGRASAPGSIEPRHDPIGATDPWADLWFYTNPMFVAIG